MENIVKNNIVVIYEKFHLKNVYYWRILYLAVEIVWEFAAAVVEIVGVVGRVTVSARFQGSFVDERSKLFGVLLLQVLQDVVPVGVALVAQVALEGQFRSGGAVLGRSVRSSVFRDDGRRSLAAGWAHFAAFVVGARVVRLPAAAVSVSCSCNALDCFSNLCIKKY